MARSLKPDRLVKVRAGNYSGRKYLIHDMSESRVVATEGWFKYTVDKKDGSPEDEWVWSTNGRKTYPIDHFDSAVDVGRVPNVGERRSQFPWAMEELEGGYL